MTYKYIWILYLILPHALVVSHPVENRSELTFENARLPHVPAENYYDDSSPKHPYHNKHQIISVRITSSVAVARGRPKNDHLHMEHMSPQINQGYFNSGDLEKPENIFHEQENLTDFHSKLSLTKKNPEGLDKFIDFNDHTPPHLVGANIEYIKQLNFKKDNKNIDKTEQIHPYQMIFFNKSSTIDDDSIAESSMKTETKLIDIDKNIPLARSLIFSQNSKNYVLQDTPKNNYDGVNNTRLTTVNFNVIHNNNANPNYEHNTPSINKHVNSQQYYDSLPKVYSEPSRVYSEPAKFYSEPAKFYSEPAKIYSEPAKVYSEPAKIYSEPAKFYSQPASLFLPPQHPWHQTTQSSLLNKIITTTPMTTMSFDETTNTAETQQTSADYGQEENYEVDEEVSVMTNGRAHGVQETSTERCKQSNCKIGYVVEGSEYKKYRVESKTSEGFIVGEYGVVRNQDGALRGVRYTANSDVNPRLIQDGLMKFLQLQ